MVHWLLFLGGMLIWATHFGGVYAIASIFDVVSDDSAPGALWATAGLTFLCLLANLIVLVMAIRGYRKTKAVDEAGSWMFLGGALLAGVSFIAVLWQGLPALFVR